MDFELPAPAKVWSAASFGNYSEEGHETFESYLNGLSDNLYKTWDTSVRAGYLAGLTAKQINRNVLGSVKDMEPWQMQALRKSLEMNTRTMVAHLAETARDETYRQNSRLFSGYRYVGTLDSRTCLVCGELDGKKFETLEEAPQLPAHNNCRCLYLPVIKGMEDFDDDDERASVDGPVSASMTYEDWLKTQPDDVVMDILGPTRFELYRSGMPITSFVADGNTLSLDKLAEKEGLNFATTNTNDETPAIKIDRGTVDYSHLSYEKALHEEAKWLNEQGRVQGREYGTVLSHENRVLGSWVGTKTTVNVDPQEFRETTRGIGSVDFIHTHLDGTLFSYKDMNSICRTRKVDKLMVSLPNDDVYYLTVNNGYRPSLTTLEMTWKYHYNKYEREEIASRNVNELLPNQEADVITRVVDTMAYMFNWKWGKI